MPIAKPDVLELECNWQTGFQYRPGFRGALGYLLEWNGCGGLNLAKDLTLFSPTVGDFGPKAQCIGLIERLAMNGASGPMDFTVYVGRVTAANVLNHFAKPLDNLRLKLAWAIIDFDEAGDTWFEAAKLKSPASAEALMDTEKGRPKVFLDNQPATLAEDLDIRFHRFQFRVVPAPKKSTTLEFATNSQERRVTKWGSDK
ncbi:hypothetical protein HRD49_21895 [Corallococcus exiguus]|uniref:Uncharacterized protein n=1 Tax=Corallococcus exiguus TaxID=83462 RepID=A0A7X4Y681_9BACT|nr:MULTISPECIES: hypothetical protein [Corallococcus]NBC39698.1 hypothetical protein [Corallococcus exiguus]NNC14949.1 hypothetical protein [Corallococcus exiguus]NRD54045.1 hypothetical protein [Corallococcus exiguus]NRD64408.1 hypothetical protein [Corallococcus exiguus]RKH30879.1 hypothetical protein D7V77_01490 [Corallococcus sp. CA041A]